MRLAKYTPCDMDGVCPYGAESMVDCLYCCGEPEPEDYSEIEELVFLVGPED